MAGLSDKDRTVRLVAGAAGSDWLRVHVYKAPLAGFDPVSSVPADGIGYIPASRVRSVSPHRGRASAREAMGPGTCGIEIVGGYTYTSTVAGTAGQALPLSVGMAVRVDIINMDGAWPFATYPNRANLATRFVGVITDLGDVEITPGDPENAVGSMTVSTARSRFANTPYTDDLSGEPAGTRYPQWLSTDTDHDTINRAIYALNHIDPALFAGRIPWTPELGTATFPNTAILIDAPDSFIGKTFDDVVSVYEQALDGVVVERRAGQFAWIIPAERRNVPLAVLIDPSWVLSPILTGQHIGDVANLQLVNLYAGGSPGAAIYVEDPVSIAQRGRLPADTRDTLLNIQAIDFTDAAIRQASELAGGMVARYADPHWATPSVTIDVTQLLVDGNAAAAYAIANLDLAQLVELDSLPRRFPGDPGLYWVESIDEVITSSRWLITLGLVPRALITPGTRWIDLPAGLRYQDVPADVSYLRSYVYDPTPYPAGSFRATAADLAYRDEAALAWDDL